MHDASLSDIVADLVSELDLRPLDALDLVYGAEVDGESDDDPY